MSHLNINGVDKPLDHIKIKAVIKGLSEPLCGIGTYKDTLDLSTGTLTRYVKKLVLTGMEDWIVASSNSHGITNFQYPSTISDRLAVVGNILSTHYVSSTTGNADVTEPSVRIISSGTMYIRMYTSSYSTVDSFKAYLQQQYQNGTPVTVWYVLATPETEQITVPSGLTGTIEGYLTQTGTPTPSNPIYPTANGEKESGGTYSIDTGEYIEAWEARDKSNHLLWGRADTFTGTNSISARCYGLPVKSWEIDGNSQQSGVPDPDNPVYPEFVGERTENFYNSAETDWEIGILDDNGNPTGSTTSHYTKNFTEVEPETAYYLSGTIYIGQSGHRIYYYDANKNWISRSTLIEYYNGNFTTPANCKYVRFQVTVDLASTSDWMLNAGSTAKPFEPYGYKLSITSAGRTVPVYLGQVQTLRRIKKLVLTGQEDWGISGGEISDNTFFQMTLTANEMQPVSAISSHFTFTTISASTTTVGFYITTLNHFLRIRPSNVTTLTLETFKQWLSVQYASGTPVTVWYVLATPQTAITNEPLAKIGTYTDTLTSDQAGITIPTADGNNTISVGTSLAPSRFEVKVHAKPI